MTVKRQRNLWRTAFLTVTVGALAMELVGAFDNNPNTDPWTELISTYVPWQLALAVFGALVIWVPVHFIVAYRRVAKARAAEHERRAEQVVNLITEAMTPQPGDQTQNLAPMARAHFVSMTNDELYKVANTDRPYATVAKKWAREILTERGVDPDQQPLF